MIVNPFSHKDLVTPYTGTRILPEDFQLLGVSFRYPLDSHRSWKIQGVYSPVRGRSAQGIRVKAVDQKGYISFVEQMDLEVLLGIGQPGQRSRWSGRVYAEPGERDFYGLCADEDDLIDDLFDREQLLRGEYPELLPTNIELKRRVHIGGGVDVEDLFYLGWDGDRETGISPDIRLETVDCRWIRIERVSAPWDWAT